MYTTFIAVSKVYIDLLDIDLLFFVYSTYKNFLKHCLFIFYFNLHTISELYP
jgi:hypothetical protein